MLNGLLLRYIRSPEHPGKYRVVRWLGRHVVPPDGVVAEVHPRVQLSLHPRDWIEYSLIRDGRYQPLTLTFLSRNLRPSDNALLAVVNNGPHVIVAARAVGEKGRVIGVDPQPGSVLRARRNIDLNRVAGPVRLLAAAQGAQTAFTHMPWAIRETRVRRVCSTRDTASKSHSSHSQVFSPRSVPALSGSCSSTSRDTKGRRCRDWKTIGRGFWWSTTATNIPGAPVPLERVCSRRCAKWGTHCPMYSATPSTSRVPCLPAECNVISVYRGVDVNWCPGPNMTTDTRQNAGT